MYSAGNTDQGTTPTQNEAQAQTPEKYSIDARTGLVLRFENFPAYQIFHCLLHTMLSVKSLLRLVGSIGKMEPRFSACVDLTLGQFAKTFDVLKAEEWSFYTRHGLMILRRSSLFKRRKSTAVVALPTASANQLWI